MRHLHVMPAHTGLQTRDLACERGGKTLFAGLNLSVTPGQSLHLQGDNGSGKTSLLRLLCGLSPPAAGEVVWRGEPVAQARETYERDMLYLGHALALKEGLSALENLHFAAALMDQAWSADAAMAALRQMGLRGREHLPLQVLMQNHVTRGGMVVFTSHQAVNLASGDNRSHRLGRA